MAIVINEFSPINSYYGVVLSVSKSGVGNADARWLTTVVIIDFNRSTNVGEWAAGAPVSGRNLDYMNTLAWSPQGTFKRVNNSLYFYSDAPGKPHAQMADFVLYRAPAAPNDCVNEQSGIGKITNPRNPSWSGIAVEWKRGGECSPPEEE